MQDIDCVQDSLGNPLLPIIKQQRGCYGLPYPYSAGGSMVKVRLDFQDIFDIQDLGNGTYTISFTVESSGPHSLEISLGPQDGNPHIGERTVPIGYTLGIYNLFAYPAATTQADTTIYDIKGQALPAGSLIEFYAGQPLLLHVQPKDEYGNLQDYKLAPRDEFRVEALFNNIQKVEPDSLELREVTTLTSRTFFYEVVLTPKRSGRYLIDVSFRNSLVGDTWVEAITAAPVDVLPGLPSLFGSQITGEGIYAAAAGMNNEFRLQLIDENGNALGDALDQAELVEALILSESYYPKADTPAPTPAPTEPPPDVTQPPIGTSSPPDSSVTPDPMDPGFGSSTPTPTPQGSGGGGGMGTPTPTPMFPGSATQPTSTPVPGSPAMDTTPTPTPIARRKLLQGSPVPEAVTARLLSATGEIPVDISYDADIHQYRGKYQVFTSGVYQLDVQLYGRQLQIPGYLGTRVLAGELYTPLCEARGIGAGDAGALPAGVATDFTIIAKDENGNSLSYGGASWTVFLVSATDLDDSLTNVDWQPNGLHYVRATEAEGGGVVDMRDGTYRVSYRPLVAATYLLNIMRGNTHALGSPMVVQVRAGATVASTSMLMCSDIGAGACGLGQLAAGTQGVFFIQARDQFGGNKTTADDDFFYSVVGAGGFSKDSLATARGQDFPGQYRASFNTEIAGPVTITASLRGSLVATVQALIVPGRVDAQRCTMTSAAFPRSEVWTPGAEPYLITITARDPYGNQLLEGGLDFDLLMSKTDASYSVTLSVEDAGDGTYHSNFVNKEPGRYLVTGKLALESIPSQSLELLAGPAVIAHTEVSASAVATEQLPSFRAGNPSTFWLKFKDIWLNTRTEDNTIGQTTLKVTVSKDSTTQELTPTIRFFGAAQLDGCLANSTSTAQLAECEAKLGAYEVTVVPRLAGVLRLSLSIGNDVLLNPDTLLPYSAPVRPGPASPEGSFVTGSALSGCVGGRPCLLQVNLVDEYGNTFDEAGLLGVEQSISITYGLQGEFGPPPVAMASIVQVTNEQANGNQRIEFTPPTFPSGDYVMTSVVSLVSNLQASRAQAGRVAEVVTMVYRGNDALDPQLSGVVDDSGNSVPAGSFLGEFPAGERAAITIQVRDRNGVDYFASVGNEWVSVDVQPDVAELTVSEDRPGVLVIGFIPTISGSYSLGIKVGATGAPLGIDAGGPDGQAGLYEFGVVPAWPSSAAESKLEFVSDGRLGSIPSLSADAGVAFSLQIQAVDAYGNQQRYVPELGPEAFTGQLRLLQGSAEDADRVPIPCMVYNNGDASYSVSCTGTISGEYELEVMLQPQGSEGLVPLGSGRPSDPPVSVSIGHGEVFAPASSLEPAVEELELAVLASGERFQFFIVAKDSFGNPYTTGGLTFTLEVERVRGKGSNLDVSSEVDSAVVPSSDGLYQASFTPTRSGRHRISVREARSGLVIDRRFTVLVEAGDVDLSKTTATGGGLRGGIADEELTFALTLSDAYGNPAGGYASQLSIDAEALTAGQDPMLQAMVTETTPGLLEVTYSLSSIGEHNVDVLIGTARMPGSPFKVVISPRPPPSLTYAIFDSSLASVTVGFDEATDRGGADFLAARAAGEGGCGVLLAANLLSKLGEGPACEWVTDDTLRVFFGRGVSLLPTVLSPDGDTIQLSSNAVYNKLGNSYAVSDSVDIYPPDEDEVDPPEAVLSAPSIIGVCADLLLDASASSGGAGRELGLDFSATAVDGMSTDIIIALENAIIQSPFPGRVTVPSLAMGPGRTYVFRASATNFLGMKDIATVEVQKSDLPLPTVRIVGMSERDILRGQGAVITAEGSLPDTSCVPLADTAASKILYTWELTNGPDLREEDFPSDKEWEMHKKSLSTRYMYIPGNTLRGGVQPDGSAQQYEFTVKVEVEGDPVLTASATVTLNVAPEPISARIQGGNQLIAVGNDLVLDVVAVDPEEDQDDSSEATPFSYVWVCTSPEGGPCFEAGSPVNSALAVAANRLEVAAGLLPPGSYLFSVQVSREPLVAGRQAGSQVEVTVVDSLGALSAGSGGPGTGGGVVVVVPLPGTGGGDDDDGGGGGGGAGESEDLVLWSISISAPVAAEVSPMERLILQGIVVPPDGNSSGATLTWSCVEGDLSAPGALQQAAENSLSDNYLSLQAGSLTSGQQYRFRLQGGGAAAGAAGELVVQVAAAPWAGALDVLSPLGISDEGYYRALELVTELQLTARDWTHGMVYDFMYVPNVETVMTGAGLGAGDWKLPAGVEAARAEERFLGRAAVGSTSLTVILPEGLHLVVVYITSASGGVSRVVFPELFQISEPPRFRRSMQQVATIEFGEEMEQAERSVQEALEPALGVGDFNRALQFVEIFASRYSGTAPTSALSGAAIPAAPSVTPVPVPRLCIITSDPLPSSLLLRFSLCPTANRFFCLCLCRRHPQDVPCAACSQ